MPDRDADAFAARVRAAQADAWQVQGRLRASLGGGALELHGHPADGLGTPAPAVEQRRRHRTGRGRRRRAGLLRRARRAVGRARADGDRVVARAAAVPQATHGPACRGLRAGAERCRGWTIREAGIDDVDAVVRVSAAGFEEDPELERPWAAPHLGAEDDHRRARDARRHADRDRPRRAQSTTGRDRRSAVGSIAVAEAARRRGVGAAIASWLTARGLARGAGSHTSMPTTTPPRASTRASDSWRRRASTSTSTSDRAADVFATDRAPAARSADRRTRR